MAKNCPRQNSSSFSDKQPYAGIYMPEPPPIVSTWLPDTGATHYMTNSTGNLTSFVPYTGIDTVSVGNGHQLPITHIGHKQLLGSNSKFLLNTILVVPSITKNLVSVRRFVHDNKCNMNFNSFGLSVKDQTT